jgi:hypothetical protein
MDSHLDWIKKWEQVNFCQIFQFLTIFTLHFPENLFMMDAPLSLWGKDRNFLDS